MQPYSITANGRKVAMARGTTVLFGDYIGQQRNQQESAFNDYLGNYTAASASMYVTSQMEVSTPVTTLALSEDARMLVTSGSDGLLQIWNTQKKTLVAEFVQHGTDYVLLSRENPEEPYYKMSPGGSGLVALRMGKQVYPFECFDLAYNQHHKILQAIADPVKGVIRGGAQIDQLIADLDSSYQQRVEIMTGSRHTNVHAMPPNESDHSEHGIDSH